MRMFSPVLISYVNPGKRSKATLVVAVTAGSGNPVKKKLVAAMSEQPPEVMKVHRSIFESAIMEEPITSGMSRLSRLSRVMVTIGGRF
jgi:hypothetical protein